MPKKISAQLNREIAEALARPRSRLAKISLDPASSTVQIWKRDRGGWSSVDTGLPAFDAENVVATLRTQGFQVQRVDHEKMGAMSLRVAARVSPRLPRTCPHCGKPLARTAPTSAKGAL